MKKTKFNEFGTNPNMSDQDYWKQFETITDEEGFVSKKNHEVNLEVSIKYSDMNGLLYETKEKNINCNIDDLSKFFNNLKKTIRMVDESLVQDKEPF